MTTLQLAWKSARARALTTLLTVLSIALSSGLFLGVEKIRAGARTSFEQTISGTDLIVGARSSQINLLLYSVFRLGEPVANVSWESYQGFAGRADVDWTVPLSLGDSHRQFRVLGTEPVYFERYRYAGKRSLVFAEGQSFDTVFEAVLGSEVARKLGYRLGDSFPISHGLGGTKFSEHRQGAFKVVGILAQTGTPVDRTIHVSLAGLEAVHGGSAATGYTPQAITAFLVGLKSRVAVLRYQRDVNTYRGEALSAIIPAVALTQIWQIVGGIEQALRGIALLVVVAGLAGMLTSLLTSLNERRREIAVLRSVGARSFDIFSLLVLESTLLSALGSVAGCAFVLASMTIFADVIETAAGVPLGGFGVSGVDIVVPLVVTMVGFLVGFIPGWQAYRRSLSDGLTVRV